MTCFYQDKLHYCILCIHIFSDFKYRKKNNFKALIALIPTQSRGLSTRWMFFLDYYQTCIFTLGFLMPKYLYIYIYIYGVKF